MCRVNANQTGLLSSAASNHRPSLPHVILGRLLPEPTNPGISFQIPCVHFISGLTCKDHSLPPTRGALPPGKGGGEKQDVGGHGRRGWCLEVPLFPLHPNLQSTSSHPFLKFRHLEPTQDTPPQPQPCWDGSSVPFPCLFFLPHGTERAPYAGSS